MNNIYMAKRIEPDCDQLNYVVVVAENEDSAIKLCFAQYCYGIRSFLDTFTIEKIGVTDKPCGTLILRDY